MPHAGLPDSTIFLPICQRRLGGAPLRPDWEWPCQITKGPPGKLRVRFGCGAQEYFGLQLPG
jgi:hypothetical protein